MKRKIILFFLLYSVSFYGQNDTISDMKTSNISVVSADKMNVVYRGLPNPISISLPNCRSFEATGIGVYKVEGRYQIVPGPGLESIVKLEIILLDGSVKKEEHKFRIKNIPRASGAINGLTCNQSLILMCKKELKNATISIDFPKDFIYELKFNLEKFVVKFSNKKFFVIEGKKFTNEVNHIIDKLPLNSIFEIEDLTSDIHCDNCSFPIVNPIKIMIIEDKNYIEYEEDK